MALMEIGRTFGDEDDSTVDAKVTVIGLRLFCTETAKFFYDAAVEENSESKQMTLFQVSGIFCIAAAIWDMSYAQSDGRSQ